MSPLGSDEGSGSDASPVETFGRVQEILAELHPAEDVIVRVRSDQGIYRDQSVVWEHAVADHGILFESYPDSLYAEFSGEGVDTAFFVLRSAAGRATNLHFRRLAIRAYTAGAFLFAGEPGSEDGWNGGNTIVDCVMSGIGNGARPERHIAWAVVDLVNSRLNVIESCAFIDCANAYEGEFPQDTLVALAAGGPSLPIIGVYLAHGSSCNSISGCSFLRIKGDAVRIRDGSNGNEISGNLFEQTGWTAVCTMWYRYRRLFSAPEECPSWKNEFHHNLARGNWLCGPPELFHDMAPELSHGCPRPAGDDAYRIHIWENETEPCVP